MEKKNLFGMCYLLEERKNFRAEEEAELLKNLGVRTIRQWMHCTYLMKDKRTFDAPRTSLMHEWLSRCKDYKMANIGLNHCNFNEGTLRWGKPARDIRRGSTYVKWLNDYYETWFALASEFPEIGVWEVDNELNNPDFLCGVNGEKIYNVEQMAEIALDVLYYASRAIHAANPASKVVLGGLTEPEGLGKGNFLRFLRVFYEKMHSGNFGYLYGKEEKSAASRDPEQYFQIMCWHPYVWTEFDESYFIDRNFEYYEEFARLDGRRLPVFFTEMGFNDEGAGEKKAAERMRSFFEAAAKLPFLETVNYYKLYDVGQKDCFEGNGTYSRFGLFYDPDENRAYPTPAGIPARNGAPKDKAFVFQDLAKGAGRLDLLLEK